MSWSEALVDVLAGRAPVAAADAGRVSRDLASDEIGWRLRGAAGSAGASVNVTQESALRSSAVWACLNLHAQLESSLPIDAFTDIEGMQVEVTKPQVLEEPFLGVDITEHLFSSRFDMSRYGNSVSVIRARNAFGLPTSIELAPMSDTSALVSGTRIKEWRICGETYRPGDILHEKGTTIGGWPIALSPIAYAALTLGGALSAAQFVQDWFTGGASPSGVLRNTVFDSLDQSEIDDAKAKFKLATAARDIFVTGSEWEWIPAAMDAQSAGFLEERQASVTDIARYLNTPGDMIDAPASGSSVTYANITERNLQLLVINVGPVLRRRERFWSRYLMPSRRYMKFNTDAFLRMDPQTATALLLSEVNAGMITPTEYRKLKNRPPYTPDQVDELETFGKLKGANATPAAAGNGVKA